MLLVKAAFVRKNKQDCLSRFHICFAHNFHQTRAITTYKFGNFQKNPGVRMWPNRNYIT